MPVCFTLSVCSYGYQRERGVEGSRVVGQYTYEQVIFVLHEGLDVDCVTSPIVDAMVTHSLHYVSAKTPPEIHEFLGDELLDGDAGEEVGTQSS
jgi:hypothetical protein